METIEPQELENLKDALAGTYEHYAYQFLPYSNSHAALVRLELEEMSAAFASYPGLCAMYKEIAGKIREAKTADELRAYMLEVAEATQTVGTVGTAPSVA